MVDADAFFLHVIWNSGHRKCISGNRKVLTSANNDICFLFWTRYSKMKLGNWIRIKNYNPFGKIVRTKKKASGREHGHISCRLRSYVIQYAVSPNVCVCVSVLSFTSSIRIESNQMELNPRSIEPSKNNGINQIWHVMSKSSDEKHKWFTKYIEWLSLARKWQRTLCL